MKLRKSGTKTKIGICILLFSFILFPISPSICMADNGGTGAASGGKEAGAAPGQAEAAGAAAAQAGAGGGLSGTAIVLIAAAVAVAIAVAVAASDDDGAPAVTPPAHH